LGNHKFEILRRDGSGMGELHQNWTDVRIPAHRERSFRANVNTDSDRW
jgi:hypothetical protein